MEGKQNKYTADLLVITSYPQKGKVHGAGTVGVASYAKNTLLSLLSAARRHKKNPKIVVLAERLVSAEVVSYQEDGLKVRRVWKRGSILSYFSLLYEIWRFRKTKKILIEFELSMFGGFEKLFPFPLFLFLLKLLNKEIILVSHQVVDDINILSGHVGLEQGSIKADFINVLIFLFYKLTFAFVDKIIVFEEYLKEKLGKFTSSKKIVVIPHGVEEKSSFASSHLRGAPAQRGHLAGETLLWSYEKARKELKIKDDEFVILYFGFIAWYKGTDWIVEKVASSHLAGGTSLKLIIAGGVNPNHTDKKFYMDYVESIERKAQSSNGKIVVTGFIEEKQIPLYFTACDLVVLPYRAFMSSSGPLSLAFSFGKPFMISEPIAKLCKTPDFQTAQDMVGLDKESIIFGLTDGSFEQKLLKLQSDKSLINKLTRFSEEMRRRRKFEVVGEDYYNVIR